jgi:hypothetical protein
MPPINFGSSPVSALRLGAQAVTAAYLGSVSLLGSATTVIAVPAGFDWQPPVTIYETAGVITTSYSADAYKVAATASLYVAQTGNDTTGTGTEGAPYRSIKKALQTADTLPDESINIFVAAGEYNYSLHFSSTSANKNLNIIATGGRALCTNRFALTTWASDNGAGSGTYRATRSNITDVRDARYPETMPDGVQIPQLLTKSADLATCQTTPGTWFTDNVSVWVHTHDGRSPDAGVGGDVACLYGATSARLLTAKSWFVQGFDFEGVSGSDFLVQPGGGVSVPRVVIDSCTSRFQRQNNHKPFNLQGVTLAIINNCQTYRSEGDGFSYSQIAAGSPSVNVVEIGCRAYYCGYPATNGKIINSSTSHADCRTVRINCDYRYTYGPVVADINRTKNWLIAVRARDCLGGWQDSQDSCLQAGNPAGDTVETWADRCVLSGAHYDIYAGTGCTVRYRNMAAGNTFGTVVPY